MEEKKNLKLPTTTAAAELEQLVWTDDTLFESIFVQESFRSIFFDESDFKAKKYGKYIHTLNISSIARKGERRREEAKGERDFSSTKFAPKTTREQA